MQEEFVMKKAEKELKKQLRQDVEIPSVVRKKTDMAFTKIKNEAKQDEAGKTGRVFMPRKRIAIVATVLTLVIGTGTLAGVQYAKWSDGVNISVHGTDKQKEKLDKQGYTSYPNVSVTRNGVTVTVTQCIADSYGAVISLKVEGYQPPKGKAATFGKLWFPDSRDTLSAGGGGFYEVSSNKDGSSNTVKEDGTMEYIIGLSACERGSLLNHKISIALTDIGYDLGKNEMKIEKKGVWNLEWILKGSNECQKFDINKEFGNTGVKLVSAEISALGLELVSDYPKGCKYADMNGEHQPPSFAGVKMKDGKVYTYESVVDGSGEQFETGSSGKLYGKFTETVTTKKILEVKQIKALLFFKKSAGDSETYKAEDYYEIPLEVEK